MLAMLFFMRWPSSHTTKHGVNKATWISFKKNYFKFFCQYEMKDYQDFIIKNDSEYQISSLLDKNIGQ